MRNAKSNGECYVENMEERRVVGGFSRNRRGLKWEQIN